MEYTRLSFFLKKNEDKWALKFEGLFLVFENLRSDNTWTVGGQDGPRMKIYFLMHVQKIRRN